MAALLAADMPLSLATGHPVAGHLYSWTYCVHHSSAVCVQAVERVLSADVLGSTGSSGAGAESWGRTGVSLRLCGC